MKPLGFLESVPEMGSLSLSRKCTVPAIVLLTALSIGISVICLNFGYTVIFQNLFYLPIILVCIYYPRLGIIFTTLICLTYLALMILIPKEPDLIPQVLVRIFFFELVAGVIVRLSKKMQNAETMLMSQRDNLAEIVRAQTEELNRELEQSKRLEQAYRETTEYYERCINQLQIIMVQWNTEQYITRTNRSFEHLLGRSREDLVGRRISTIPWLADAYRRQSAGSVAIAVPGPNKETRTILWIFSEVFLSGGTVPITTIATGTEIVDQPTGTDPVKSNASDSFTTGERALNS